MLLLENNTIKKNFTVKMHLQFKLTLNKFVEENYRDNIKYWKVYLSEICNQLFQSLTKELEEKKEKKVYLY